MTKSSENSGEIEQGIPGKLNHSLVRKFGFSYKPAGVDQRGCYSDNVTPADVYFGWDHQILARRENIKHRTLMKRKLDFDVQKITLT